MKPIYHYLLLPALLFSLAACNNDDEEPYVPGPYSWDFGYTRGKLNGKEFSLQNEGGQIGRHIPFAGSIFTNYGKGQTSYGTNIPITKGQDGPNNKGMVYGFSVHIAPVECGDFDVVSPVPDIFNNCDICFWDERNGNDKKTYKALKQPLKLHISRAESMGYVSIPFIEGVMNGILYNTENPNDSIIVENVEFGVH